MQEEELNQIQNLSNLESCSNCGGAGVTTTRGKIIGCPCCADHELYKPCKECNGKGMKDVK